MTDSFNKLQTREVLNLPGSVPDEESKKLSEEALAYKKTKGICPGISFEQRKVLSSEAKASYEMILSKFLEPNKSDIFGFSVESVLELYLNLNIKFFKEDVKNMVNLGRTVVDLDSSDKRTEDNLGNNQTTLVNLYGEYEETIMQRIILIKKVQFILGYLYEYGYFNNGKPNYEMAKQYYSESASETTVKVAFNSHLIPRFCKKKLKVSGNSKAQIHLGILYATDNIGENKSLAKEYFKLAMVSEVNPTIHYIGSDQDIARNNLKLLKSKSKEKEYLEPKPVELFLGNGIIDEIFSTMLKQRKVREAGEKGGNGWSFVKIVAQKKANPSPLRQSSI